jgi:spore coat polysaccharide biosynthesis protein SpsF
MTALILQGRLDSTRLPGKSLLPLGGEALIYRVMEALLSVPADVRVLACPEDYEEAFTPPALKAGFEISTGPKDDVLARYVIAIRRFSADRIIRATADNPFVFADAAARIYEEAAALDADYAGYSGLPYGAGVEAVSAAALFRAEAEASAPGEREHVCPYLYNHPEIFSLHRPLAPKAWQGNMRLTVDTQDDYERAKKLYDALPEKDRHKGEVIIHTWGKS